VKNTLRIGSVSTGTLRLEDLIPAVLDVLEPLRLSRKDRATVRTIRALATRGDYAMGALDDGPDDRTDTDEDFAALCEIADFHCPAFCYFGAHEGDGADIGVWIDVEGLRAAVLDGDVVASDLSPSEMRDFARVLDRNPDSRHTNVGVHIRERWAKAQKAEYFHYLNDHGNISLYRRVGNRFLIEWEVV
jgi:hypothetical protein